MPRTLTEQTSKDLYRTLTNDRQQLADRIRLEGRGLVKNITRVEKELGSANPIINELGELQRSAQTYDQLCVRWGQINYLIKDWFDD